MSIKSVYFLLVTICIASSGNAQLPQFSFPFPFPFPNPFQPSPGGSTGIPGIPGFPKIPGFPFPFPNPFQPSPGGSPGIPDIPGFPKIPGLPFPFPNPFQPSPGGSPGIPGIPGFPKIPGLPFPFPNPFSPSPGGSPGIPNIPRFPFPNPFQPSPGSPRISDISGNPEILGLADVNKCWSTFMDMPGCFAEIRQSIMTGKFGSIGPACCKAFLDAEANCASNLPFQPIFPPMVKQQCSQAAGPPMTL